MNNQINNRFTVNDEGVQRMIDNNSAMYYSNQMIIAQNMTHQPVNTIKAYSAKQKEWKKFDRKGASSISYGILER
ncbi:hypothetical protein BCV71DRAFT_264252 [Rhizopus microsporus]|uniref:Uncharacterized protein n=1 Tax=Rhizopus microsporus TaxID=58291 RepID=A0A1X0S1E6_RHIZD|nr:hypothetical protein BCV71DRAFT_264252 [Rhizopus microsporus]